MAEITLEEQLVSLLMKKNMRICCAESCTGGMVAAAIVNVPNASSVLDMSFITYANEAKVSLLGVDPAAIEKFGVVSETVAGQMAAGAAARAHTQVGVATSGIAGPTGGTDTKPIGMVCFGFWINGTLTTSVMQFGDLGRNEVRRKSTEYALRTLCRLLQAN